MTDPLTTKTNVRPRRLSPDGSLLRDDANWRRRFNRMIREHFNYTCQKCGERRPPRGRGVPTVEIVFLDGDPMNVRPGNVTVRCRACHPVKRRRAGGPKRSRARSNDGR